MQRHIWIIESSLLVKKKYDFSYIFKVEADSVLLPAAVDQEFCPFGPEHGGFRCCSWLARDDDLPAPGCRDQPLHGV